MEIHVGRGDGSEQNLKRGLKIKYHVVSLFFQISIMTRGLSHGGHVFFPTYKYESHRKRNFEGVWHDDGLSQPHKGHGRRVQTGELADKDQRT